MATPPSAVVLRPAGSGRHLEIEVGGACRAQAPPGGGARPPLRRRTAAPLVVVEPHVGLAWPGDRCWSAPPAPPGLVAGGQDAHPVGGVGVSRPRERPAFAVDQGRRKARRSGSTRCGALLCTTRALGSCAMSPTPPAWSRFDVCDDAGHVLGPMAERRQLPARGHDLCPGPPGTLRSSISSRPSPHPSRRAGVDWTTPGASACPRGQSCRTGPSHPPLAAS